MRVIAFIMLLCSVASLSYPQVSDSSVVSELEEVVFSSNKFREKKKFVAQRIDVISSRQINRVNTQNTGDLLLNSGNVFVQKSQQGGSSPVIRGFEASRVLLVVDGIRMNNAIYRSGHLQNVITVDQNMLDRVEVLYGPSSTIFGSDALGGVLHFRTKNPVFSDSAIKVTGNAFARYSSANNERTAHADVNIASKNFGSLTSVTISDFDDMKMGNHYRSAYPDFGRRTAYVARINGADSIVANSNDRVQKFSGYRQWDILQKFSFRPSAGSLHTLNVQVSGSTDVPRYDRLQDLSNGRLRFAEWYYGPQNRLLAAYEYQRSGLRLGFEELRFNVHYQRIIESRHQRNYRSSNRDNRQETLQLAGFNLDARRKTKNHEITVGFDGQFNFLESTAFRENIITAERSKLDTRYPDGNNDMNFVGAFAQHTWKSSVGKWVINDGLRLQYVGLHSTLKDTAVQLHLPYTDIRQQNIALTGNLGVVYNITDRSAARVGVATGFRNPNIDDLAKIFESSPANRQLVVPNQDIKPEYTYNVEFSLEHQFAEAFNVSINAFYTWFRNAIVVAPFRLNGQDSVVYNGNLSAVLASQNRNKASLRGFSAYVHGRLSPRLSYQGTINWTEGRFETDPAKPSNVYRKQADGSYLLEKLAVSEKPLDHIPPVFGRFSLLYSARRWNVEGYSMFNGWKRLDDYNADGEDNAQYATADGMPGWYTLNIRTEWWLATPLRLQAGVENILDRNYRTFASGFSAAGRNVWVSLRASF